MAFFISYFYPVILGVVPILFDQLFKWMFHKDCLFRAHFSTPLSTLQVFLALLLHILRPCNAPPLCAARFLETDFQSFTCQLRNSVIKPGCIDHIFDFCSCHFWNIWSSALPMWKISTVTCEEESKNKQIKKETQQKQKSRSDTCKGLIF